MEKVSLDLDEASYYTCKSNYDLENADASLQGAAESKEQLAALDNASGVGNVFKEIADGPSNSCNDDYLQEVFLQHNHNFILATYRYASAWPNHSLSIIVMSVCAT